MEANPTSAPETEKKQLTREEALALLNERTRLVRKELAAFLEDNDYQKRILLRYPRLVSHLICHSLGYFCPRSAANAIHLYKDSRPFWCEWYAHMAGCTLKNWDWRVEHGYEKRKTKPSDEEMVIEVGKGALQHAVKNRHSHKGYMAEYLQGRSVILHELAGRGPQFASWF